MKKILIIGFILVILLSACTSSVNNSTATVDIQHPTVDAQRAMEMTRESFAMETLIALEQSTSAPTPEALSNLPKPWTDITTFKSTPIPAPNSAIAAGAKPRTSIFLGPGYEYRMACYVGEGTQLIITGRDFYSFWLRVALGQGQTCFLYDENFKRTDIVPDPSMQLWVFHSTITISGDLSQVAIITPAITPTRTPTPYGAAFLWNDIASSSLSNVMNSNSNSFNIKYGLHEIILVTGLLILSLYQLTNELVILIEKKKNYNHSIMINNIVSHPDPIGSVGD